MANVTGFMKKLMLVLFLLTCVCVFMASFFYMNEIRGYVSIFRGRRFISEKGTNVTAIPVHWTRLRTVLSLATKDINSTCVLNKTQLKSHVSPADRQQLIAKSSIPILNLVSQGGSFKPPGCKATGNVAVIAPYRDRENNLKQFLPHMHSFLQTQLIEYTIFIVELVDGIPFNRGLLMNVGFQIATQLRNFTCFVFHDVDLLPTNEHNLYDCLPKDIRFLATGNSKNKYKIPYPTYFGGVVSFSGAKYREVNGFSNLYFGWGNEDDDLNIRVQQSRNRATKLDPKIGRYEAINHTFQGFDETPLVTRKQLISGSRSRRTNEGVNSLIYKQLKMELRDLYTWVLIDVNKTDLHNRFYSCQKKGWKCDFKAVQVDKRDIPANAGVVAKPKTNKNTNSTKR